MELLRVTQRPEAFDMIRWDGSAQAADWVSSKFGSAATFEGTGDDQTLKMWGSWEIPRGDYIVNRWESFNYVPVDQLSAWQLSAPEIQPATGESTAGEPAAGEPATGDGTGEQTTTTPAGETTEAQTEATTPDGQPVPDTPPETETSPPPGETETQQ